MFISILRVENNLFFVIKFVELLYPEIDFSFIISRLLYDW